MSDADAIEGEVVVEHPEMAIVPVPPQDVALSRVEPAEFLARATRQADALADIIEKKKLSVNIGGSRKGHVLIEGWQALMALNGVMPFTVDLAKTRCVKGECATSASCPGGRLTVTVTTDLRRISDGVPLTSISAECSQHESRWARADEYAVVSMAQTRGIGKACRQLFGWVMALAGYEATPADEMPATPDAVAREAHRGMTDDTRLRLQTASTDPRGPASSPGYNAAVGQLKDWGYRTWSDFLARGQEEQANAIIAVLDARR